MRLTARTASLRFASLTAAAVLALSALPLVAQDAPAQDPSAPAPAAAPVFPKVDPANFTATTPTKETVNAFIQASWGFDENRVWQVAGILKTEVAGISKVIVYVGDKTGKQKPQALEFFALPDGKHIIAGGDIISFGDKPYADKRAELIARADGPTRGAASKDLELVEFADFQCPHCKLAQPTMEKLAADFPKARIVFQTFPLVAIHPAAAQAAAYGACVTKLGGSTAFFQYASAVFEGQDALATADGATLTLNSAATKAGLDPAKVAACAATPATKTQVDGMIKLAEDLKVNETPTLFVNGRSVPVAGIPYEVLKQIIEYQAKLDGVAAR